MFIFAINVCFTNLCLFFGSMFEKVFVIFCHNKVCTFLMTEFGVTTQNSESPGQKKYFLFFFFAEKHL